MIRRTTVAYAVIVLALAAPLAALTPGTDVLVPAVALAGDWRTDLYIFNYDTQTATVDVELLIRGQANPTPESATFVVAPGETAVLENVLADTFGKGSFAGAFRVTADYEVVVNTRIFNYKDGVTFGQGFEGIPRDMAVQAGEHTDIVGAAKNASFRTNLVMIDATGDFGQAAPSQVRVSLHDEHGSEVATVDLELGGFQPFLQSLDHASVFGASLPDVTYGTLHCEVLQGAVIFAASKIDNDRATGDPTTLAAWTGGSGHPEPPPTGDVYLYSSTGDDDVSSVISEWNSGSTLTELAMDGFDRVMQVDPGNGWGAPSSCIAFMEIGDYQTNFDAIVFKIKSSDLSAIYVKVPEVEFPFPFDEGTDLGDGWYEVTAPFSMFTGTVDGTTQIGIHGGYSNGGTFFITDVMLTVDEE